eukprot:GHVT01003133.1.p1 GENE.GHVT01003133.1~~GHVT01003133.1.p1  ORF type:complete len:101 (-),score=5.51 GHVT01003133.1:302-604(-)
MLTRTVHPYSVTSFPFLSPWGGKELFLAETIMTVTFLSTFLRASNDRPNLVGVSSAAALLAAYGAIGPISGACLNPALAIGSDIAALIGGKSFSNYRVLN